MWYTCHKLRHTGRISDVQPLVIQPEVVTGIIGFVLGIAVTVGFFVVLVRATTPKDEQS